MEIKFDKDTVTITMNVDALHNLLNMAVKGFYQTAGDFFSDGHESIAEQNRYKGDCYRREVRRIADYIDRRQRGKV